MTETVFEFSVALKTEFALLLHSSGLSLLEAAKFLDVRLTTIQQWKSGRIKKDGRGTVPIGALETLRDLVSLQGETAKQYSLIVKEGSKVVITDDEYEAQMLGWPTASAMNAAVRRLLELVRVQPVFNPEVRDGVFFLAVK